jgi:hypothetical protein
VSDPYETEAHCPNCKRDTRQRYTSAGHERDSSHDKEECLECGAYRYGMSSEWQMPDIPLPIELTAGNLIRALGALLERDLSLGEEAKLQKALEGFAQAIIREAKTK